MRAETWQRIDVFAKLSLVENVNAEIPSTLPAASEEESEPPRTSEPEPNNPPWKAWMAIAVWAASVGFIVVTPLVFLMPYLASTGRTFTDNSEMTAFLMSDKTAIILQIAAIFPAHLLTFALAWLVVTQMRQYPFRETLGWKTAGVRWWHYALILIGFFILSMVVGSYFPEQEDDLLRIARSSTTAAVLIAIMAVFTAPIVEEVVYRGLLYSAFQRTIGKIGAIILVTLLFTAVHVPQYYENPSKIVMLALLSLIITLLRAYSGNLLPAIILHTVFNAISAITLLLDRYIGTPLPAETPAAIATGFLYW